MRCTAFIAITDGDAYRWVESVTTGAAVVSGAGATALDASAVAKGSCGHRFLRRRHAQHDLDFPVDGIDRGSSSTRMTLVLSSGRDAVYGSHHWNLAARFLLMMWIDVSPLMAISHRPGDGLHPVRLGP